MTGPMAGPMRKSGKRNLRFVSVKRPYGYSMRRHLLAVAVAQQQTRRLRYRQPGWAIVVIDHDEISPGRSHPLDHFDALCRSRRRRRERGARYEILRQASLAFGPKLSADRGDTPPAGASRYDRRATGQPAQVASA